MHALRRGLAAAILGMAIAASPAANAAEPATDAPEMFIDLLIGDRAEQEAALARIADAWHPTFTAMSLEAMYLGRGPELVSRLTRILREETGEDFGFDIQAWWEWQWNRPAEQHPHYAAFKSTLYGLIDPKFAAYFDDDRTALVRLDEVVWGGVVQDGIPPLRHPEMIAADAADYLDDDNVIFGLAVDGDVRAYPKRILAWHEMFVDQVGGVPVAGVYCTLCGTMILYGTEVDGTNHAMGTSGFLYRSNKLMYDEATQSLWNTIWGRPVIGPLADEDIELERMSVVTTTWGEWRRRHPDTLVLSLDTGHRRDYAEGAAYSAYFATDELMFTVPVRDTRLANKAEVVGLVFPDAEPLAISADYLADRPVHHDRSGAVDLVVLTDTSGANRVYAANGVRFSGYDGDTSATDTDGEIWTLSEDALRSQDGRVLERLPAHRAFWFGWFSAYSDTRLVM